MQTRSAACDDSDSIQHAPCHCLSFQSWIEAADLAAILLFIRSLMHVMCLLQGATERIRCYG